MYVTPKTTAGSFSFHFDEDAHERLFDYIQTLPEKLDSVARSITLTMATEKIFGVRGLPDPSHRNPIPFIVKDDNLISDALIESTYSEIIDLNMPTHTGMPADELLNLPSSEYKLLVKLCKKKEERQRKQIENLGAQP